MLVNSYFSGRCQLLSDTPCQKLNVRDSMSETQCQRLNVSNSMLDSNWLTWFHLFAMRPTWVSNLALLYKGIVDLLCWVLHSWTTLWPLVNADRQLISSMLWVVFFNTEMQNPVIDFEMCISHLNETQSGAIVMAIWWRWWWLSGYQDGGVDMTVIKLTLTDLSKLVIIICVIYQPTTTTSYTVTNPWRDDHSNTHLHGDWNMEVDLVEKEQQMKVRKGEGSEC